MSLVNDMLKDLDQRRKSSDSSSVSMKLMPASDMPVEKKNRILIYISLALVMVLGGLAYLWSQQGLESTERQLNIVPRVVTTPSQPEESVPAENQSAMATAMPEDNDNSETSNELIAETVRTPPLNSVANQFGENGADDPIDLPEPTTTENPIQSAASTAVTPSPRIEDEASGEAPQSNTEVASVNNQPPRNSVINQPPPESIKNEAQLSADARDTLAVQAALRLIADNNTPAAYAHLEQHIINNRYAHQSRETYAKLLMNEGELLAAYNLVESGLGLAPNHAGFKKVKARILIADGQIAEAVALLSRRAPSVSQDIEYHEILATAQLASRDFEGASMSYTTLVQQDQTQGKWWYGFAASQDSLGNQQAARQAYSRAIAQANLSPNLRRRSQERLNTLSQ